MFHAEFDSALLALARSALTDAGTGLPLRSINIGTLAIELQNPHASFVTLLKEDSLRGCIGSLKPKKSLAEDVCEHTYSAALNDYRFPPVTEDELTAIAIEISILTEPELVKLEDRSQIPGFLRPGIDGVMLERDGHRATFLPQVWERVDSPTIFLNMLCEKAALPNDAWLEADTLIYRYQGTTIIGK